MRVTHLRNVDLNLLGTLAVVLEERHVSRAAVRCHLSQSAMSRTLLRLRETFADELLVRTGGGYELTPRARSLQRQLHLVLPQLEWLVRGDEFDPAAATTTFRLACTDYATTVLGPGLFRDAPGISLVIDPPSVRAFDDVERGRLDMILTPVEPPRSLRSETLFHEELVCVLAQDHPVTGARLTLEEFQRYSHIEVAVYPADRMVLQRRLDELRVPVSYALRLPFFTSAIAAVPGTTLIATVARRLAEQHRSDPAVRLVEAPVELEPFAYQVVWHDRLDGDPAYSWLRDILRAAGRELETPSRG